MSKPPARTSEDRTDTDRTGFRTGSAIPGPHAAVEAVCSIVVEQHAETMLRRGGAANKARAGSKRGTARAAARAAAAQGKGHLAELCHAVTFTADSGIKGRAVVCEPNPCANAPHADLFVKTGPRVDATVQVGVGGPSYLKRKARLSKADQVVIDASAVSQVKQGVPSARGRVSDRVHYEDVSSKPVAGVEVEGRAAEILESIVTGAHPRPAPPLLAAACRAGASGAFSSVCLNLLLKVMRGEEIDARALRAALAEAWDSFLTTATQAWLAARHYLTSASSVFKAELLHTTSRSLTWFGALAEVLVGLARDLCSCFSGKITLAEVWNRLVKNALVATGAAAAMALAMWMLASFPMWIVIPAIAIAAWAGSKVGEGLFQGLATPSPVPAVPLPI